MQTGMSIRRETEDRHRPASHRRADLATSFATASALHVALAVCAGGMIALRPAAMVPAFKQGESAVALTLVMSEPAPEPSTEPEAPVFSDPTSDVKIEPTPPEPPKEPEPQEVPSDDADALTKGVRSDAQLLAEIRPAYPLGSRMRGEEGVVTLGAVVDAGGKAVTVTVIESSGFTALDNAASRALRETTFVPAQENGFPVEGETTVRIRFRLVD